MISTPPSKVDAPHETVSLEIASAAAVKRLGAPGADFGVWNADAVLALVEVEAWSVTVTTLNSSGAGPVEGAGAGALGAGVETDARLTELILTEAILNEALRTVPPPLTF